VIGALGNGTFDALIGFAVHFGLLLFFVIGLVCTKPQKRYEKRVPNIDKQALYEYNICGKRRFSKTSYSKTRISFVKKGKLL